MIRAQELRIGNMVLYSDEGEKKYCVVRQIHETVAAVEGSNNWGNLGKSYQKFDNLEGIPLTPEILEKCGFNKGQYIYEDRTSAEAFISHGRKYVIRRINIGGDHPEYWGMEYFPYPQSQNTIPAELQHLHQLQNLYFALCGEELQIKL